MTLYTHVQQFASHTTWGHDSHGVWRIGRRIRWVESLEYHVTGKSLTTNLDVDGGDDDHHHHPNNKNTNNLVFKRLSSGKWLHFPVCNTTAQCGHSPHFCKSAQTDKQHPRLLGVNHLSPWCDSSDVAPSLVTSFVPSHILRTMQCRQFNTRH